MFKRLNIKWKWLIKLFFFYGSIKLIIWLLSFLMNQPFFNTLNIENMVISDISFNDLYYRTSPKDSTYSLSGKVILVNAETLSADRIKFREQMADLIDKLQQYKPAVIGVDYTFSELADNGETEYLKNVISSHTNIVMASCIQRNTCEEFDADMGDVTFPKNQITHRRYYSHKNTFGYKIAQRLQPGISDKYLNKDSFILHYLTNSTAYYNSKPITSENKKNSFVVFDANTLLNDMDSTASMQSMIQGKAILIGNLGPFNDDFKNQFYTEDKHRVSFDTTSLFNRDRTMAGIMIHANAIENLLNPDIRFQTWSDEKWFIIMDEILLILFLAFLLFVKAGKLINIILLLLITFPLIYLVLYLMLNHLIYIEIGLSLLQFLIFEELAEIIEPFYERTQKWIKSIV